MIAFGKQARIPRNTNRVVAKYLDGTGRYEIKEGSKNHPAWHCGPYNQRSVSVVNSA